MFILIKAWSLGEKKVNVKIDDGDGGWNAVVLARNIRERS